MSGRTHHSRGDRIPFVYGANLRVHADANGSCILSAEVLKTDPLRYFRRSSRAPRRYGIATAFPDFPFIVFDTATQRRRSASSTFGVSRIVDRNASMPAMFSARLEAARTRAAIRAGRPPFA